MKRNRCILAGMILASGIFASFYGGNVPYAIFYLTLSLPVLSLLYTFFVYVRFRLYQKIDERKVLKGEMVPYAFTLSNEDILPFTNIKVNFFTDKSYVAAAGGKTDYLLLPGQSDTLHTTLCCKYRGEYDVGVKSVEITDFLFLFSITYPNNSRLNLTVLPRVFPLERLGIAMEEIDPKCGRSIPRAQEELLDVDVRKYAPGDSRRYIHWKASARRQELLTRRLSGNARMKVLLFMDLSPIREKELLRIITEDQIVESALSVADYYRKKGTDLTVFYDRAGYRREDIHSDGDFKLFYEKCFSLHFNAASGFNEFLLKSVKNQSEDFFGILFTHTLSAELCETVAQGVYRGHSISVLLASDDHSEEMQGYIREFARMGVTVRRIGSQDNVSQVLSA